MIGKIKVAMLKGEKGETGASGDYASIDNKPLINGVVLDGAKTAAELGLAEADEQQDLRDAVASMSASIESIESRIDDIGAYVVTADYDPSTKTFSNPSAGTSGIFRAIANNKPCYLVGINNNEKYIATCTYSALSAARFSMPNPDDRGSIDVWELSAGTFYLIRSKVEGSITPTIGVSSIFTNQLYAKGSVCVVNLQVTLAVQDTDKEAAIGTISGLPIPSYGYSGVCNLRVGSEANYTKTAMFTLAPNGLLSIFSDYDNMKQVRISFAYIV